MINIAKLLKDVPKGWRLYSPLFGEVNFVGIDKQSDYPINVTDCKGNGKSFTEFGVYFADHPDAECLLFPSKDCRTWEGWKLPVEPKFQMKDWLVYKDGGTFCYGLSTVQVQTVEKDRYIFTHDTCGTHHFIDSECRIWTIADAKDGDVLSTDSIICIFKKLDKDGYYIISPCIYTVKDGLEVIDDEDDTIGSYGFKPATKEDRELLFRKMKEAGYEWDTDKKELKKIQPHYDIANFHEGMPVLVRNGNCLEWEYVTFSHYRKVGTPFCAGGQYWFQCIPFNGDTKHLLGTTDMCPEEYINW